jgi:hypothetical protein
MTWQRTRLALPPLLLASAAAASPATTTQRFAGKTVVVKYGGAAMKDPTLKVWRWRVIIVRSICPPKPCLLAC